MDQTNVDHIVVFHDKSDSDQPWRWRAVAGNGEPVTQGESHSSEHDAERAAKGVFGENVKIEKEEEVADESSA